MSTPENAPSEAAETATRVDVYRTVVSLLAGGIGEGIDRLAAVKQRMDASEEEDAPTAAGPFPAAPAAMAVVGAASEMPSILASIGESAARMTYPVTRVAGVAFDTVAYVAEATGVASFVAGVTEPARRAMSEEYERLASVGSAEYARGRVLATEVFTQSVDGIMGYIGESDELGELVREQTLGVTGAAVQEIRETGAAADGITENVMRRIFGRSARTVPPRPASSET